MLSRMLSLFIPGRRQRREKANSKDLPTQLNEGSWKKYRKSSCDAHLKPQQEVGAKVPCTQRTHQGKSLSLEEKRRQTWRKRTWSGLDQGSACGVIFKGQQPWQECWLLLHPTSWPTSYIPVVIPTGRLGDPDTCSSVTDNHSHFHGKAGTGKRRKLWQGRVVEKWPTPQSQEMNRKETGREWEKEECEIPHDFRHKSIRNGRQGTRHTKGINPCRL